MSQEEIDQGIKLKEKNESKLAALIDAATQGETRVDSVVPGLTLHRWEMPTDPASYLMGPSICLIGQGKKRVFLGEEAYVYDAHSYLLTSVDLPLSAHILDASAEKPYLGVTLALDLTVIADLMLDQGMEAPRVPRDRLGLAVSQLSAPLLDAMERLIALQGKPEESAVLAPLIRKEISYRLLTGEQGDRLRHIVSAGSHSYQVARAIDWLKENFRASFKVEDLAARSGLSPSAFHSHFRAMTAMSPLQFQKKMRLSEARRLMFTEHLDAGTAAFEVGYESPSQFSREYRRLFGAPPLRDMKNLGQIPAG